MCNRADLRAHLCSLVYTHIARRHAPVCERCDDEALSTTHKLILVLESDVCKNNVGLVQVLPEVDAYLSQPVKVHH